MACGSSSDIDIRPRLKSIATTYLIKRRTQGTHAAYGPESRSRKHTLMGNGLTVRSMFVEIAYPKAENYDE